MHVLGICDGKQSNPIPHTLSRFQRLEKLNYSQIISESNTDLVRSTSSFMPRIQFKVTSTAFSSPTL